MARKMCKGILPDGTNCPRSVGTGPSNWEDPEWAIQNGWCFPCADEGQMDIAHLNGHESIPEAECWYCHPELDARLAPVKIHTGHTNTATTGNHHPHTACKHARTPQGRAACRKANVWDDTTNAWVARPASN